MDGDFSMKRIKRWLFIAALAVMITYLAGIMEDKISLRENLVRLHVVANSDSQADQDVKLQVRDAVVAHLNPAMENLSSAQEARDYLSCHLKEIQTIANDVLAKAGFSQTANVTLREEAFPIRHYDTFSLPAGIYDALRITIGKGEGHNWWCVVFPSLCIPASSAEFQDAVEVGGFPEDMGHTLTQDSPKYEIRFCLLDWLGRMENKFASLS